MKQLKTVDEYVDAQDEPAKKLLKELRKIIKNEAPEATEKLSYGMPYYNLNGRLLYMGGFKDHISLYPMKSGIKAFKKELSDYETSAGTIRFPLDKPLPYKLIKKIVDFRVEENLQKKSA